MSHKKMYRNTPRKRSLNWENLVDAASNDDDDVIADALVLGAGVEADDDDNVDVGIDVVDDEPTTRSSSNRLHFFSMSKMIHDAEKSIFKTAT